MSISVALSKWGPRIRAQVQQFSARWPTFSWGTYPGHDPSEPLATDGMVPGWSLPGGRTKGRKVADAIWAERKKNGAWYVIHWGQIISITYESAGWRPYFNANSTNPSKSHKNHVHVSWHKDSAAPAVDAGPVTPPVVVPKPPAPAPYTEGWLPELPWVFYLDKQGPGVIDSTSVWLIQRALNLKPRDGNWVKGREDVAVAKYQRNVLGDDPKYCDGILGASQAKKLFGKLVAVEKTSQ